MEIPIAVGLGYAIYKKGGNVALFTALAVFIMYVTVVLGHYLPINLAESAKAVKIPVTGLWAIILLLYAYAASTLPVTTLLQPRDYINAWQLFVAMGLMTLGVFASTVAGKLHLVAPAVNLTPAGAPPIWPFLCVTIACGAISGFHSLVSSGTTPKQVSNEQDAQFVGYGSMLMEAALATLVIVAVAAGIAIAYQPETGAPLCGHHSRFRHPHPALCSLRDCLRSEAQARYQPLDCDRLCRGHCWGTRVCCRARWHRRHDALAALRCCQPAPGRIGTAGGHSLPETQGRLGIPGDGASLPVHAGNDRVGRAPQPEELHHPEELVAYLHQCCGAASGPLDDC